MRGWVVGLGAGVLMVGQAGCFEEAPTGPGPDSGSATDGTGEATATGGSGMVDGGSAGGSSPDEDCPSGFTCAGAVLPGWQGPVARFIEPGPALPDCGGDYPYLDADLYSGLVAPPAECSPCGCGEPQAVQCQGPWLRMFTSLACAGAPALEFQLEGHDVCTFFGEFGIDVDGMESDPVVPIAGTGECAASGGGAELPEPSWTNHLRACGGAPDAGACGEGGSCLPVPGNPLAPGLCVFNEGDVPCPAGPYSLRNVYYDGFEDARGCSACECGAPGGVDCDAIIEVHYNDSCSNLRASVDDPAAGACYGIDGGGYAPRSGLMNVYGTNGGACEAGGGQPGGEASPSGAVTFCCTQ